MARIYVMMACLLLLGACSGYKAPSMSGDPAKMSADTLCFRYASAKDPALGAEIDRRDLDCAALLQDDPLYRSGSDFGAVYSIGR
ncbi:MAG: hypothetical protein KDJ35_04250 [Alphaproteobacteria bacterium]|nr:hypothetical protein [Alphaproteobacteria bacterium]